MKHDINKFELQYITYRTFIIKRDQLIFALIELTLC